VVHVAEAYKPDLSDLAPSKARKTKKQSGGLGIEDLVREFLPSAVEAYAGRFAPPFLRQVDPWRF
jgi:hypothetical protein